MSPTHAFYFEQLYPLQDLALTLINQQGTGFYLTGGTVVSRVYLHHRFSDDLDLFANLQSDFGAWCGRVIDALVQDNRWRTEAELVALGEGLILVE